MGAMPSSTSSSTHSAVLGGTWKGHKVRAGHPGLRRGTSFQCLSGSLCGPPLPPTWRVSKQMS